MILLYGFLYRNFCDYYDKCNKMNIKIDLNELYSITWAVLGTSLFGSWRGVIIRIYDNKKN
jgi:hypothetical protein